MTAYYTPREERALADEQVKKAGVLGAIELFMCSDGNYRDADSKFRFDETRRKLLEHYTTR